MTIWFSKENYEFLKENYDGRISEIMNAFATFLRTNKPVTIEIFKIKPCGGRDLNPRTPTGRDPQSCFRESTWINAPINNQSPENIYQEAIIDYQKYREEFAEWMKKESPSSAERYISYLDKLIGDRKIYTPHELAEIFEDKSKNAKVAIRNFMRLSGLKSRE